MEKKGLGRGLDALFATFDDNEEEVVESKQEQPKEIKDVPNHYSHLKKTKSDNQDFKSFFKV